MPTLRCGALGVALPTFSPAGARLALGVGLLLLAPAAAGQGVRRTGPVLPAPMPARDDLAPAAPSGPAASAASAAAGAARGGSATFVVTYDGFPAEARAAFQAAVDAWATHVASAVPIRVEARWAPLGDNVLGSAGPFLIRDFDGAPLVQTWYPDALANALAGRDLDPAQPDVRATFNSAFARWHLDPATPPPPDRYDLASVVLHELGHGLGFIGSLDVEGGVGFVGADDGGESDGTPFVFDRFTEDAAGRALLSYAAPSAALAEALQQPVYFDGPAVRRTLGDRAPLYSPPGWVPGTSYSHLDEGTFPTGDPNALMTPFFVQGERVAAPDAAACAVLVDLGWPVGEGCAALVPGVEPAPAAAAVLALAPGAPNPSRGGTTVRLTAARAQHVVAGLYDAAGRRVAALFEGAVEAEVPLDVAVPGALASGVYFVRADGEAFTVAVAVTLLR